MKYTNHTVAGSLRVNYERYLYPYERFLVKTGKLELKRSMSHDSQRAATPRLATPSPVKSETSTPTKCKYGLRQNRRRPSHLEVHYSLLIYMSRVVYWGGGTLWSPHPPPMLLLMYEVCLCLENCMQLMCLGLAMVLSVHFFEGSSPSSVTWSISNLFDCTLRLLVSALSHYMYLLMSGLL